MLMAKFESRICLDHLNKDKSLKIMNTERKYLRV